MELLEAMAETLDVAKATFYIFPILLLSMVFLIILNHSKSSPPPPGPNSWPIFGNLLQMGENLHVTLSNFAQSYGPLISLRLGHQTVIVGSSVAAAREILKTHDRALSRRWIPHAVPAKSSEINWFSLGWAPECNDGWRGLRMMCRTELFSRKAIESQACVRERKVMEMVKLLSSLEGEVVEVAEVVTATLFNMMSNIFLSRDFVSLEKGRLDGGTKDLVRTYVGLISSPNLSDFYPILGALDLQGLKKRSKEAYMRICALWEPIIAERRERKTTHIASTQIDFLDTLIDSAFTNDQINNLFLELFTAGVDTSTVTIEWAIAELIKNPESLHRIEEELKREIKQDLPKESHLPQLPYLQACVKETLRLHPPGPMLLPRRSPDEPCKLMNYTIPKNSQILINVWMIGRDPLVWEEPLKFRPERFINSTLDFKGNDFEFVPFGAGRRMCPGLSMAANHISLLLASLLHFFNWSLPHGNDPTELDMDEKFALVLQKKQPLRLIPQAKKQY